ncbi:GNAT family N-acetyltransferase [uncultured Photobacterium sp.]|uniref:GNAT family N-acetyltransferase n=1 Tax=uncultured Photobacterium sp. TaxID=173973 RepID=UPI00262718CF|nr:GNAT family N-acetyltransferase [uncultured Photobacterium sp.]
MKNERIKLVPPSLELVNQMLEAILESQMELEQYLTWVPNTLTLEGATQSMEEAIDNFTHFNASLRFFIIHQVTGRLLGAVGLIIRDKSVPYFEVGYWLRTSELGNGYVTEAIVLLEKYAFDELEAIVMNERRLPSGQLSNTAVYRKLSLDLHQ